MRALILTAGLGTRLRPLTLRRAKAAVPVNGEPIVRRVIQWLATRDIHDLVLNLHHHPESIAAVVGDGADMGARVRYSWEHPLLGSAGGPRHALPLLVDCPPGPDDASARPESFLLVNGDTLTDVPLGDMRERHRASGALVTMALIRNPRPDLYGGVLVKDDRVAGFSRRGASTENFHFVGVQIAEARAFARLEDGTPAESVMGLYPGLMAEDPGAIAAFVTDAPFSDVGTPDDYLRTSLELADVEGDRLASAHGVTVDSSAVVHRTAVWEGVTIGARARIDECILCDGVSIPAGSRYTRCAIVPHDGSAPRDGERVDGALLVHPF